MRNVVNPDPTAFNFHIGKGLANSGSGTGAAVLAAVQGCVDNGAKVISMSLGGSGASSITRGIYDMHYGNGVLIVAAAGNSGNGAFSYPASYEAVMSVAAVSIPTRNRASFSQFNSQLEISGPGVQVQSTSNLDLGINGIRTLSGTSMVSRSRALLCTVVLEALYYICIHVPPDHSTTRPPPNSIAIASA